MLLLVEINENAQKCVLCKKEFKCGERLYLGEYTGLIHDACIARQK